MNISLVAGRKKRTSIADKYLIQEQQDQVKFELAKDQVVTMFVGLCYAHFIFMIIKYTIMFIELTPIVVSSNLFYVIMASIGPFVVWIISTDTEYWNFWNRKTTFFYTCVFNSIAVIIQPLISIYWKVIVENVFKIPVTQAMTQGMVIFLAQYLMICATAATIAVIIICIKPLVLTDSMRKKIACFKLCHVYDFRKNKDTKFDLKIVKNLETGKVIPLKEEDRYVHIVVNGASGTGKTSSIFLPAVEQDMDQKLHNKQVREVKLIEMLLKKEAYFVGPIAEFDEYKVRPKKKYKAKFERIWKNAPDCGITIMAPNNSIIEDVIRLAEARDLTVNVLDPSETYDAYKNVLVRGINPFYVPLNLLEKDRTIRIESAATVFSDVLVAINEKSGNSNEYFENITKQVSTNIATLCMLARNIEGRQTDITEIQLCMTNFDYIKQFVDIVERHFDMNVVAPNIVKKKGEAGQKADAEALNITNFAENSKKSKRAEENPYYQTILFIKSELLGAGSEEMFSQARGLRNLINKLLGDPRVKNCLAADKEHAIDFDKLYSENQVTLVNTALEFGSEKSRAFGLFFLLTHKTAALRRPKKNRTPHYLWIDEVAQYMHPALEDMFTLYRQYKTAVTIALQALSQTEKSNTTKYLKSVFLGAGTHIVFGRLSPDEMELYSAMAGSSEVDVEQKTTTQTSILSDNPTISDSERVTPTQKNYMEGSDMRLLDFQEVSILTIDRGRVLAGQFGKVAFLKSTAFQKKPYKKVNWEKLKKQVQIVMPKQNVAKPEDTKTKSESDTKEKSLELLHQNSDGLTKTMTQYVTMYSENGEIKTPDEKKSVRNKPVEKETMKKQADVPPKAVVFENKEEKVSKESRQVEEEANEMVSNILLDLFGPANSQNMETVQADLRDVDEDKDISRQLEALNKKGREWKF